MPKSHPPKRAKVWDRFIMSSMDPKKVTCTLCNYTSTFHTTSNLERHLKAKHLEDYEASFGSIGDVHRRSAKRQVFVQEDNISQQHLTNTNKKFKGTGTEGLEQHFWMQWNNQTELFGSLSELLSSESYIDVTLFVEGHTLSAHKLILSAASPYFAALFKSVPNPHPVVFMRDVSYNHMKMILDFIYKGEAMVNTKDLNPFLATAKSLQIKGLAGVVASEPQVIQMIKVLSPPQHPHLVEKAKEQEIEMQAVSKDEDEDQNPEHTECSVHREPEEEEDEEETEEDEVAIESLIAIEGSKSYEDPSDIQDSGGTQTELLDQGSIAQKRRETAHQKNYSVTMKAKKARMKKSSMPELEEVFMTEDPDSEVAYVLHTNERK